LLSPDCTSSLLIKKSYFTICPSISVASAITLNVFTQSELELRVSVGGIFGVGVELFPSAFSSVGTQRALRALSRLSQVPIGTDVVSVSDCVTRIFLACSIVNQPVEARTAATAPAT
jgi:hypothetical protein